MNETKATPHHTSHAPPQGHHYPLGASAAEAGADGLDGDENDGEDWMIAGGSAHRRGGQGANRGSAHRREGGSRGVHAQAWEQGQVVGVSMSRRRESGQLLQGGRNTVKKPRRESLGAAFGAAGGLSGEKGSVRRAQREPGAQTKRRRSSAGRGGGSRQRHRGGGGGMDEFELRAAGPSRELNSDDERVRVCVCDQRPWVRECMEVESKLRRSVDSGLQTRSQSSLNATHPSTYIVPACVQRPSGDDEEDEESDDSGFVVGDSQLSYDSQDSQAQVQMVAGCTLENHTTNSDSDTTLISRTALKHSQFTSYMESAQQACAFKPHVLPLQDPVYQAQQRRALGIEVRDYCKIVGRQVLQTDKERQTVHTVQSMGKASEQA